jgi:hypothetical protein
MWLIDEQELHTIPQVCVCVCVRVCLHAFVAVCDDGLCPRARACVFCTGAAIASTQSRAMIRALHRMPGVAVSVRVAACLRVGTAPNR